MSRPRSTRLTKAQKVVRRREQRAAVRGAKPKGCQNSGCGFPYSQHSPKFHFCPGLKGTGVKWRDAVWKGSK